MTIEMVTNVAFAFPVLDSANVFLSFEDGDQLPLDVLLRTELKPGHNSNHLPIWFSAEWLTVKHMRIWWSAEPENHPWMTHDLGECGPRGRIRYGHAGKEVFAIWSGSSRESNAEEDNMAHTGAQPRRIFDKSSFDLRMQGRHAPVVKRYLPTHKDVKDHSKTPYIHLRAYILLSVQEFWGSKVRGSAQGVQVLDWVV